jgi:hypothetical protein
MRTEVLHRLIAVAGLFVLTCRPATALTITINDLTETVTVTSDGANTEISIDDTTPIEIVTIFDPALNNLPGGKSVALIEPGAVPDEFGLTLTSDIIGLDFITSKGALVLNSGGEGPDNTSLNCALVAGTVCIPETGSQLDVAPLLFGPNSGVVINLTSGSEVPEPASVALFGTGVAVLGWIRTRRRSCP